MRAPVTITSQRGADRGPASLFSPTALSWLSDSGASLLAPSFIHTFMQQVFMNTSDARLYTRPVNKTEHVLTRRSLHPSGRA